MNTEIYIIDGDHKINEFYCYTTYEKAKKRFDEIINNYKKLILEMGGYYDSSGFKSDDEWYIRTNDGYYITTETFKIKKINLILD